MNDMLWCSSGMGCKWKPLVAQTTTSTAATTRDGMDRIAMECMHEMGNSDGGDRME